MEHSPEACSYEKKHEYDCTCVERTSEGIDKEEVEICCELRQVWYDAEQYHCENHYRYCKYLEIFLEAVVSVLPFLVVEHEYKGWDGEEVEEMYSD